MTDTDLSAWTARYNKTEVSAYQKGYAAGLAGQGMFVCPYSPVHHSADFQQWNKGHADGRRDALLQGRFPDGPTLISAPE